MTTNTTFLTDTEIGCVKNFVHMAKIDHTVKPVRQKLRRLPFAVRASVSAELDRLLKAGVIERVDASAWVSPIVVTGKKTGGIRMCADLREVNKAVITDCYPLPHIDEMLTSLRGATVFSTIDLANAYYQLPLHEDCRDITAFITHDGLFRYCRVPYGLASAPSAFQKMMATILEGVPGAKNYLDDVIVYGETAEDHDFNLSTVLQKLKESGLVLNEKKCNFKQTSLRFLGHVISANGILPDREHLNAVCEAPPPSDAASLQSFLGLVSWYSKFLPGFATVVAPMRECAKEKGQFSWTPAAQSSFENIKQMLVSSPALAIYDPTLHSIISTDASDYGLGAVFTQVQSDGTEKPVAFASRTLTDAEKKYSIVEKEALACVWATEKWRTYVWGHRFTLRTDHQALTTLLSTKGMGRAGMRIARWAARLLCFNYDVVYRPGSQNHTADCLSRLPIPSSGDDPTDLEPEIVALISSTLCSLSVTDFETACAACPELEMLRKQITHGWPPSIKAVSQDMIPYFRVRDELAVKDAFIFRGTRLLVPVDLRHTLISLAHESHQGIVRTKQRLRDLYWWPQMDSQVQSTIATCIPCQSNDKSAVTHPAPLQPVQFPEGPWKKLGLDVVGPFETAIPACRYAITLTDYHSKWPELAFASSATTVDVIKFLSTVFSRHGNPESIVTDNGTQFTSAAFAEFLKERDIKHIRTSVYYPASNGAVERFHRALKGCVQTAIQHSQPWNKAVTEWLQVYRATPHATTGVSPYELLYGRKMRTKLNILPLQGEGKCDLAAVRENVEKKQDKMKLYTDHRRGARNPLFGVGGKVRIRLPRATPKGHPRFSAPVRVEERVGTNTFLLSDGKKWNAAHLAYSPEMIDCASNTAQQTHNTTQSAVKVSRMRLFIRRRSKQEELLQEKLLTYY
ncbi:retrotransposable element [Pimephales promelas]|nr:retrotransposable element [Pimephales promelas]